MRAESLFRRKGSLTALLLGLSLALTGCGGTEEAVPMDTTVTVEAQTVSTGSLALEESYVAEISTEDSVSVFPKVSGVVTEVRVSAGDTVQAGDVLCRFEDAGGVGISRAQASLNYQELLKSRTPTATISGTVSETYVRDGDSVSAGAPLLRIVSDSDVVADFLFTYAAPGDFYIGQSATVFIDGFAGSVQGTVTSVSDGTTTTSNGKESCTVRVKINNPGALTDSGSYTASAVIGSYTSYGQTPLAMSGAATVYAAAAGTVSGFTKLAGSAVTAGERLCTISSDALDAQIESARLSLASTNLTAGNYTLTAPISGLVEEVNVTANNMAPSGAAVVISASGSRTATFYVPDDVAETLTQGQAVTVENQGTTYTGAISEIGVSVDAASGLFRVKAALPDAQSLSNGMTVTLTTAARSEEDTVLIPTDALYFDGGAAYVYLAVDGTAVRTPVTVGLYTADQTAITSGLAAGDTLITTWSAGLKDGAAIRLAGETAETAAGEEAAT